MSKAKTKSETVQVFWKLPENLVDERTEAAGPRGNWAESFRKILARAEAADLQLAVEGPGVSKAMSLPEDVEKYLEREALRLCGETGQHWSAMKVAREIWRQSVLPGMTRRAAS